MAPGPPVRRRRWGSQSGLVKAAGWKGWHFAVLAALILAPSDLGGRGDRTRVRQKGSRHGRGGRSDRAVDRTGRRRVIKLEVVPGRIYVVPAVRHLEARARRQLEALPGGTGIIADDVMAGIYAALVLLVAGWFNLY